MDILFQIANIGVYWHQNNREQGHTSGSPQPVCLNYNKKTTFWSLLSFLDLDADENRQIYLVGKEVGMGYDVYDQQVLAQV